MISYTSEIKKYFIVQVLPVSLLLIWITAIFSPFFEPITKSFSFISLLFMKMFSAVCHQENEKSFLFGKHIYVCARCAGIYTGCFLSALSLLIKLKFDIKNLKVLLIALLIIFADVLFANAGLYEYSHSIAFIAGLFFGFTSYRFFINTFEEFLSNRIKSK